MFVCLFVCFERERERERERENVCEHEGGADRIPSRLHMIRTEPNVGLELTNRETST